MRTGRAGRCGGRAAGGFEEVQPFLMPVPAIGQVKGEAVAAVAGGAGGDTDQGPADRGRAGPGVAAPGEWLCQSQVAPLFSFDQALSAAVGCREFSFDLAPGGGGGWMGPSASRMA